MDLFERLSMRVTDVKYRSIKMEDPVGNVAESFKTTLPPMSSFSGMGSFLRISGFLYPNRDKNPRTVHMW